MTAEAKAAIRALGLARRAGVSPAQRTDLAAACVQAVPTLAGSDVPPSVASAFLPIRGEPDTAPLLDALLRAGLTVALPTTPERGRPLRFRAWSPGAPLVAGRFGTREPTPAAPEVDPQLLFVPLAAFDRAGHRVGYGAGYYDGALARLRHDGPVLAVGLGFAAQEVDRVPAEPHDQRLDAVLTERGLLVFGPDACASSSSAT